MGENSSRESQSNQFSEFEAAKMRDGVEVIGAVFDLDVQDDDCLFKESSIIEGDDGERHFDRIHGELNGIPFELWRDSCCNESGSLIQTTLSLLEPNSDGTCKAILSAVKKHGLNRENIFKKYSQLRDPYKWSEDEHMNAKFQKLHELFEKMERFAIRSKK